jgi:hypothetical protein
MIMSTPDPTQTASGLADALARSTGLRGQAMQHLDQLHQAQQTALAIEVSRVANRYGAASAEIKVVQARVAAHAARGRVIAAERQRTQLALPDAQPDAFIVYGRVLDHGGTPLKEVEITVISGARAPILSTRSLANGSFQLTVPATVAAAPAKTAPTKPSGPAAKADAPAVKPAEPSAVADSKPKSDGAAAMAAAPEPLKSFQLSLTDSGKTTTYRDPEVFKVTPGALAYREIAMPPPPT